MKASTFWKIVVADESDFLERFIAFLEEQHVLYCVIGGQAVNVYMEPVVSLDLDIVIAFEQLDTVEPSLRQQFEVERFAHSLNIGSRGSDLRVQIQTDPRYAAFVGRAAIQDVLGTPLPVADIADVLQGKVWAASDPTWRPSKRLKDLSDIARIVEFQPALADMVPAGLREKLS
jgi:hypothetical protein